MPHITPEAVRAAEAAFLVGQPDNIAAMLRAAWPLQVRAVIELSRAGKLDVISHRTPNGVQHFLSIEALEDLLLFGRRD